MFSEVQYGLCEFFSFLICSLKVVYSLWGFIIVHSLGTPSRFLQKFQYFNSFKSPKPTMALGLVPHSSIFTRSFSSFSGPKSPLHKACPPSCNSISCSLEFENVANNINASKFDMHELLPNSINLEDLLELCGLWFDLALKRQKRIWMKRRQKSLMMQLETFKLDK